MPLQGRHLLPHMLDAGLVVPHTTIPVTSTDEVHSGGPCARGLQTTRVTVGQVLADLDAGATWCRSCAQTPTYWADATNASVSDLLLVAYAAYESPETDRVTEAVADRRRKAAERALQPVGTTPHLAVRADAAAERYASDADARYQAPGYATRALAELVEDYLGDYSIARRQFISVPPPDRRMHFGERLRKTLRDAIWSAAGYQAISAYRELTPAQRIDERNPAVRRVEAEIGSWMVWVRLEGDTAPTLLGHAVAWVPDVQTLARVPALAIAAQPNDTDVTWLTDEDYSAADIAQAYRLAGGDAGRVDELARGVRAARG